MRDTTNSSIIGRFIDFIRYHNAFVLVLLGFFLIGGTTLAASPEAQKAVVGEKIVEKKGIDNSMLLATDLDNFDMNLRIRSAKEDESHYYLDYSFNTIAPQDHRWQRVRKRSTLKVSKKALGGKDLGIYASEELSEVAQAELRKLKKIKQKQKGPTFVEKTTKYSGLAGLVLNPKTEKISGYEPVVPRRQETSQIGENHAERGPSNGQSVDDSGSSQEKGDSANTQQIASGLILSGRAAIQPGSTAQRVKNENVSENSKIFISFRTDLGGRSWHISDQGDGYFEVRVSEAVDTLSGFDYWIVQTTGSPEASKKSQNHSVQDKQESKAQDTNKQQETNNQTSNSTSTPEIDDEGNGTSTPESTSEKSSPNNEESQGQEGTSEQEGGEQSEEQGGEAQAQSDQESGDALSKDKDNTGSGTNSTSTPEITSEPSDNTKQNNSTSTPEGEGGE